jgi:predicted ATPase
MLTDLRVKNFKAFQDTLSITLKPLTLLSGINSAGKSSIIQALLLLKQTLESPPSSALAPGKGRLLNQSLGDNFNDFLFGRPSLEDSELIYQLAFSFDPDDDIEIYADCQALFEDLETPYPGGKLTATFWLTFQWGSFGYRGRPTVRVSNLRIKLALNKDPLIGLDIFPTESGGDYVVQSIDDKTLSSLQAFDFSSLTIDGFSNFLPNTFIIDGQNSLFFQPIPVSFVRLFRDCFVAVRRDLSDEIYYLNSFREPPSRVYTTGQTSGRMLEPDGSNFAEVLWQLRDEVVTFVHPRDGSECMPLAEMTDHVLREVLELHQSVTVEQAAQDILEIKVQTLGPRSFPITLTDVGLGYNQILPVVIQGLLTPPGGLVIFEQPEIHLHPDVQAKLITFFVGLAKAGRRVLVETHSSHLIEHLCLAIAHDQSEEDWLVNHTGVLFVHPPDTRRASAHIEPIKITPYGEILNWPPHFLPDIATLDEEIIRAGFAKRQKEEVSPV